MEFEYIDRANWNTVCLAGFDRVGSLDDVKPGDFFIAPEYGELQENGMTKAEFKQTYFGGIRDGKTLYPILLTVERVMEPYHIKAKGYGSIAFDLCFKMSNPN